MRCYYIGSAFKIEANVQECQYVFEQNAVRSNLLEKGYSLHGDTPAIITHSEAKEVAEDMIIEAAETFTRSLL